MKAKLNMVFLRIKSLIGEKVIARIMFIVLGISSTVWFLIRVIPKLQRATYPCMRAAAPVMSAFVIYLITLSGTVFAFKKAKNHFLKARYLYAAAF